MSYLLDQGINCARLCCKYHPQAELIDDYHSGDMVCSECGLVVGDRIIDVHAEWSNYHNDDGEDKSRVGYSANPLLGEDLSTTFVAKTTDKGVKLLKKSAAKTALYASYGYLKDLCCKMHIPQEARDGAMMRFKVVKNKNALKGKNKETVMASLLYMECRRLKLSRTIAEFYPATGICKRDFCRVFKSMTKMFENEISGTAVKDSYAPAKDCMERFCAHLRLPAKVAISAREIVEKILQMNLLGGRNPSTIASVAIYFASQHKGCAKTPSEISNVTGIAEVTVNKALLLIPPDTKFFE